jgi:glycosyltransferase involved in cell wall biosynthesis
MRKQYAIPHPFKKNIMITCNTRNLTATLTGVQRYTSEILSRLNDKFDYASPEISLQGLRGHLWEQFVLPKKLGSNLLWSPSNTGPISVEKQVVSIHDLSPLDNPGWYSRKFSGWYQFLLPRLINRARAVLTISEFTRQRILYYCPEARDKVHVTLLAASSQFKPVEQGYIDNAVSNLRIPSPHYFIALGSLEPRKNLNTLLLAWRRIHAKLPADVWLVLAGGKGTSHVFGDHRFDGLPPRVYLTGHVPDVLLPSLYSGAIASIYLSCYEGFGLPPLESMSCGTPVLASNSASLPEVVGDTGVLVDPFDIEAIGDSIVALVEDSSFRQDLRLRGLARSKLFNWDNTAKQTWKVLEEAASQ